jgi:hypothetical protein
MRAFVVVVTDILAGVVVWDGRGFGGGGRRGLGGGGGGRGGLGFATCWSEKLAIEMRQFEELA